MESPKRILHAVHLADDSGLNQIHTFRSGYVAKHFYNRAKLNPKENGTKVLAVHDVIEGTPQATGRAVHATVAELDKFGNPMVTPYASGNRTRPIPVQTDMEATVIHHPEEDIGNRYKKMYEGMYI